MSGRTRPVMLAALLFSLAGCGGSVETASTKDYADEMNAVEERFLVETSESERFTEEYLLRGELVGATHLFELFAERLGGWKSITPPPEYADLHEELISSLAELQDSIGMYLVDEALKATDDFDPEELDTHPDIISLTQGAEGACLELVAAVTAAGGELAMAGGCTF